MTLPLFDASSVIMVGSGVLLWMAEGVLPFFHTQISRGRHAAINLTLASANLLIILPSAVATASILQSTRYYYAGIGSLGLDTLPHTLILLLLLDLWVYLWHRVNHEFPLLWRFHSVHHSDRQLDVTSAWRFHPGEILLSELIRLPFLVLIGVGVQDLLLYNILMTPVIQLHHSNIRFPEALDRLLRLLIPTPLMHRIHHSVLRSEHDANYGAMLSIWDRLLGTLMVKPVTASTPVGLEGECSAERQRMASLLIMPFRPARPF